MKISSDPEAVEYDIAYAYDQLGNRTERIDHVAERMTTYSYDVDVSPPPWDWEYETIGVQGLLR